ncbi:MAG: sulfite exporter TauE/SafE family protein [Gammaproteobacteria bacterium]
MSIAIFMLAYLLIGSLTAFLAGLLGIGGGIVVIPCLVFLFGLQGIPIDTVMHLAIGSSLGAVPFNAFIAARSHRKHIDIDWTLVTIMVPGMMLGSLIGPLISVHLSGEALRWIFGVFLGILGVRYILATGEKKEPKNYSKKILWVFSPIVGVFASMLGLGGGVFIVPLLSRAGVSMRQSLAVSSIVLVPSSLVGMAGYIYKGWGNVTLPALSTGFVYWPVVVSLVIAAFFCAPIGVRLAHRLPHEQLKRLFGALLLVVAAEMCYTAWGMR